MISCFLKHFFSEKILCDDSTVFSQIETILTEEGDEPQENIVIIPLKKQFFTNFLDIFLHKFLSFYLAMNCIEIIADVVVSILRKHIMVDFTLLWFFNFNERV